MILRHFYALSPHRQHYSTKGDTWWKSTLSSLRNRRPGANIGYQKALERSHDPNLARAQLEALTLSLTYYAVLAGMAWSGHAIEIALLWWLPRHIGFSYILIFLSWAPHHPMGETGHYRDTRAWRSPLGTILSMGMEYHVIHHLFPKIPLFQTGPAFQEMRELLLERGIRNDGL